MQAKTEVAAALKKEAEEMEERSCFAYRRIYEPVEPVASLARREVPTPEPWFMISTKSLSLSPSFSFFQLSTIFLSVTRPISFLVAVIPLRSPFLSSSLCFLSLPGFISTNLSPGAAWSIVTKIVYDIDSSFYVNPVSEQFCPTRSE